VSKGKWRDDMDLDKALEPAPEYYWIELGRMSRKLVEEFFPIKPGENVVITADTQSDWRVVQETARAVYAIGATPTVVVHPTTDFPTSNPPDPVAGALQATDAWIEFESSYLLYSDAWDKAMQAGVRYLAIAGDVDGLVRMVGRVNHDAVVNLGVRLIELSNKATEMHITSSAGTDLRFKVDPAASRERDVNKAGGPGYMGRYKPPASTQVAPGQASVGHVVGTAQGTIVFDGALAPPFEVGVLSQPVTLQIENSKITSITGGPDARTFERWLASFNHPAMYEIAHCTYGFNPGITRCKGDIAHDERVFGCMEYGIGPAWADAPGHSDGTVLYPSVWADDVQLEEDGRYVHPDLVELCRELGVPGY
jgi:leucyl aminopeptidase (aminopeptidase T)